MAEMQESERRVVLVTGAARGQGLEIVTLLIERGYNVVACDIIGAELTGAMAGFPQERVLAQPLDVTSAASWSEAVDATAARFSRLDGLANNAGILYRSPLATDDPANFERAWRVNCLGPFLGIQACLPLLRKSDTASIVNTLSTSALRAFPGTTGYATSKAALRGLSFSAAGELASEGIRVNSVLPGPIATPMNDGADLVRMANTTLLGRVGQPSEIASAVVFLLSEESAFTVGAELVVDGGWLLRVPS